MAEKAGKEAKASIEAQTEETRRKKQMGKKHFHNTFFNNKPLIYPKPSTDPKLANEKLREEYNEIVKGMTAYMDSAEGQKMMKETVEMVKYVPSSRGGGKGHRGGRGGHKRDA